MLLDKRLLLVKLVSGLLIVAALAVPGHAVAEDRDPPESSIRGTASGVEPAPGSKSVRPGSPIIFNLASAQGLDAADRRLISLGRYSCIVYECQPSVRHRMFTVEPGPGCVYDPQSDTVTLIIPQQLSFTEYFVALSTSSYRPKVFPVDPDGQRVIFSVRNGIPRIFGLGEISPIKSVSHSLASCDRLVLFDRPKEAPACRYYPALPASTVFETGPEPGALAQVRIDAPAIFAPGPECAVRALAVDAYERPVQCMLSVTMKDPRDGSSPAHVTWITSSAGEVRFALCEMVERSIEISVTATQADRVLRAARTIEFARREAILR